MLSFAPKPLALRSGRALAGLNHLQRDEAVWIEFPCSEDAAHPPDPDLLEQLVIAEPAGQWRLEAQAKQAPQTQRAGSVAWNGEVAAGASHRSK